MSLLKKGKYYWLDIRIKGRRIRRSLGTDEHGLALDRAKKIREELTRAAGRGDIKFSDIIAKYKDWARLQKPASAVVEGYHLAWLEQYAKARNITYLADWTPYMVEQMRTELRAKTIGKIKKRPPTPATINRYCQLLRSIFYRAADWGFFAGENPVRRVKFLKERPQVPFIEGGQVEAIMAAAEKIAAEPGSPAQRAWADICTLALHTGLRKNEILNLRWRDIKDDELHVTGKGNKLRDVPLNEVARGTIMRQPRESEFVFAIPNRHQPTLFKRTYDLMEKRTGRPFYLHLLRHRFATSLLEKGVDLVTIAALMGHSKYMTTLLYSHTDSTRKRKAVDTLCGQRPLDLKKAQRRKSLNR